MKIQRFNESVRDMMKPKSKEDIEALIKNLTPYGMLYKIQTSEIGDSNFEKIAIKRIEKVENELGEIIDNYEYKKHNLKLLVEDISKWVDTYGGNIENITEYGFASLASQIDNGTNDWHHDSEPIYNESVVNPFIELLKNFALCETSFNNVDFTENY